MIRRRVLNPKVDQVTGLRVVDITRLWKAANDKHCPEPRFTKAALARFMREKAVNVTPAGTLWRCQYCRQVLHGQQLSLDHMDPVSVHGPNTIENLALCCAECNTTKRDMNANDMALYMELLTKLSSAGRASMQRRMGTKPRWIGSSPQRVTRVITRRRPPRG